MTSQRPSVIDNMLYKLNELKLQRSQHLLQGAAADMIQYKVMAAEIDMLDYFIGELQSVAMGIEDDDL